MADIGDSPDFITSFNISAKPSAIYRELDYAQSSPQGRSPAWDTLARVL